MEIRDAAAADVPAIWPFLHEIVAAGDTFCARGEPRTSCEGYLGLLVIHRRLAGWPRTSSGSIATGRDLLSVSRASVISASLSGQWR
jgi:hypothetical protein